MKIFEILLSASLGMLLVACGGGGSSVSVPVHQPASGWRGATAGTTASVSFTAPASNGAAPLPVIT